MNILNNEEIQIYFTYDENITDLELLRHYQDILSKEETTKQSRFRFKEHQYQYLITRALLKTVLTQHVDGCVKPRDWKFKKNIYGKPEVANKGYERFLSFNLSHSKNMIALAITNEANIGIDTELLLRCNNKIELADNYFSMTEAEQLRALPVNQQNNRFFDLWTLKEAYIKACGTGLSTPLNLFSFQFTDNNEIRISFDKARKDRPEYWKLWQITPNETHKVAVALNKGSNINDYKIHMKEIIPLRNEKIVNFPIYRQSK